MVRSVRGAQAERPGELARASRRGTELEEDPQPGRVSQPAKELGLDGERAGLPRQRGGERSFHDPLNPSPWRPVRQRVGGPVGTSRVPPGFEDLSVSLLMTDGPGAVGCARSPWIAGIDRGRAHHGRGAMPGTPARQRRGSAALTARARVHRRFAGARRCCRNNMNPWYTAHPGPTKMRDAARSGQGMPWPQRPFEHGWAKTWM